MKDRSDKRFCTLDHANKRREIAQQTPYEFWLRQVARRSQEDPVSGGPGRARPRGLTGGH